MTPIYKVMFLDTEYGTWRCDFWSKILKEAEQAYRESIMNRSGDVKLSRFASDDSLEDDIEMDVIKYLSRKK